VLRIGVNGNCCYLNDNCRMASSGPQWMEIFQKENRYTFGFNSLLCFVNIYDSGTYNNQWIILDHNLFKPNKQLAPNTFVIGEQAPGLFVYSDQTDVCISTVTCAYVV